MEAQKFIEKYGVDVAKEAINHEQTARYAKFVWVYDGRITYGVSGFHGATNLAELKQLVQQMGG